MPDRINAADTAGPAASFVLKIAGEAKGDGAILGPMRVLPRSASPYESDVYIAGLHLVVLACLEGQHQHTEACKVIPCPAGMCVCVRVEDATVGAGIDAGPIIRSLGLCGVAMPVRRGSEGDCPPDEGGA